MDISKLTRLVRKGIPLKYCGAVIVAAGTASRMGGIDKIMAPLGGEPLIARTVRAFEECDAIREIVIVTREDLILSIGKLCSQFSKVSAVVVGGNSRPESVMAGLNALSKQVKLAAIQDGARPLVSWQLIDRTVRAANTYGAAAPGIPVTDTIKTAAEDCITGTLDRSRLVAMQTPQAFLPDLIKTALTKAVRDNISYTDDCAAVEALGAIVHLTEGSPENIKITRPLDVKLAEAILQCRSH